MKTSRFSDAQIMGISAQAENGIPITELCRDHGMSPSRHLRRNCLPGNAPTSISGVQSMAACLLGDASIICQVTDASMVSQMKSMDDENKRLKKMYAELNMQNDLLKEVLGKNVWSAPFLQG